MIRARRPSALRGWLTWLREILVQPKPRVLRASVDRTRRLQKRAAQQAARSPIAAPPARRGRALNQEGFQ